MDKEKISGIIYIDLVKNNKVKIYKKEEGKIFTLEDDFYPFLFLTRTEYLNNFNARYWKKRLEKSNGFNYLIAFNSWSNFWKAIRIIRHNSPQQSDDDLNESVYFTKHDPVTQYFLEKEVRLFEGLEIDDLNRIQVDVLTFPLKKKGYQLQNYETIGVLGIKHKNKKYIFDIDHFSEKEILIKFRDKINEIDPDLIEAHRLNNYFFPLLTERFKYYDLTLDIGRNGSEIYIQPSTNYEYPNNDIKIDGRLIFDSHYFVFNMDLHKKEMDNYSLIYSARFLGDEEHTEIEISRNKFLWYFENDKEIFYKYAENRLDALEYISNLAIPVLFETCKFVPASFDTIQRIGNINKIEKIILTKYIKEKHSLPRHQKKFQELESLNTLYYTGIFNNIYKVKINFLISSVILAYNLFPETDTINAIKQSLEEINAKKNLLLEEHIKLNSEIPADNYKFIAIKSLLDSFYPFISNHKSLFYEPELIKSIIKYSKEELLKIINIFINEGFEVIDSDTDNIYLYSSGNDEATNEKIKEIIKNYSQKNELGILLNLADSYKKMLSYKKRNYVLLKYDNKIIFKGSSLISKANEKYIRDFLKIILESILLENYKIIPELYLNICADLRENKIPIENLCKVEIIKENIKDYKYQVENGLRQRSTAMELAIKYYDEKVAIGDVISYYHTYGSSSSGDYEHVELLENFNSHSPNINIEYYIKKLDEHLERLKIFFSDDDFNKLFPKTEKFDFDIQNVKVINKKNI